MATNDKTPNYTAAQEQAIRDAAPLNMEKATALATAFGKNPKSVIAKAIRMNVAYQKKVATTKTGEPVVRKETLVAQIGQHVAGSLEGLEKASKPALQNILAAFEALENDRDSED